MTVSMFEALEAEIPAVEAGRMQSAALAALYPHTSKDGARKLWASWNEQIVRVRQEASRAAGHLFSWNGAPISLRGLKQRMGGALGKGLTA